MLCYIIRGLSGSGKSTLANSLAPIKNIFCTDDLFMDGGVYKFDRRLLGTFHKKNFNRFLNAIRAKESPVVADCTFVTQEEAQPYYVRAKKEGYEVKIVEPDNEVWNKIHHKLNAGTPIFDSELQPLVDRNTHGVTLDIIKRRLKLWIPTAKLKAQLEKDLVVYDPNLPECIIADIDGTVAIKGARNAFDWVRVGEDLANEPVVSTLKHVIFDEFGNRPKLIFFSGRDGICFDETRKWLDDNGFAGCPLFMRPAGNTEKDSIIKKRLYDEHIRGKMNCRVVFDDRDTVCEMWRNILGLTVFQVQEGDF